MCAAAGENYSKIFSVKSCRRREDIVSDEGREGSRVNVNPHPPESPGHCMSVNSCESRLRIMGFIVFKNPEKLPRARDPGS